MENVKSVSRLRCGRLQDQVLHPPVLCFTGIQLVLADAFHFMYPVKLADLLPGFSEPAQHVAFKIVLVDLSAGIGAEEELLALRIGRGDADRPWCAHITDDADRI